MGMGVVIGCVGCLFVEGVFDFEVEIFEWYFLRIGYYFLLIELWFILNCL